MKKTFLGTIMSLILALTFCLPAFATTDITGVESRTQDEILTLYHLMNLDETVTTSLSTAADLTNLTTSGSLSAASEQNALDTLNFARYIAGLSYNVTIDETATQYAQDGAALLAYIGEGADHYPDQPSGVSDAFFASAYKGTSNSNISAGRSDLATNIIHGWLADSSSTTNIEVVGHRRWALIPEMTSTGFGWVKANSSAKYGYYSAMYVRNSSLGSGISGIVWPAQNMPVEYFGDDYPWSYNTSSYVNGSVTVKLTRQGDGQTWTMVDDYVFGKSGDGYIAVNNDYNGLPGSISFVPDNITYSAGDVYHVEISGAATADYTVEFFSLSDSYTTVSSVTYDGSTTVVPETTTPETSTTETTTETTTTEEPSVSGASSWAQAELQTALDAGYPVALYDDHFTDEMTRGEFAHMLGMFASTKWSLGSNYDNVFTDLGDDPADAERNNCILALYNWGVINGMTATTFAPDELVTREQAAKMLLAYENTYSTPNITKDITGYSDYSQISSWALEGVRYMNQLEVLNGTTDTTLSPQGNITVQEAALMCYRLFIIQFKSIYS